MKTLIRLLLLFVVPLAVVMTTCKTDDGTDKPLILEESDSLSYGYTCWYDTNRNNAVFGQGQTVLFIFNHPGISTLDTGYTTGDTAISVNRKYLTIDSCRIISFGAYPGGKLKCLTSDSRQSATATAGQLKASVRFPGASGYIIGSAMGRAPIEVIDNRVCIFGGNSFSVDEPMAFGPPSLAALLAESVNNPPPMPSQARIDELECGEIIGCYLISREIHVSIDKQWSWTSGGTSYQQSQNCRFGFSHYWYYPCPDGPLVHEIFVSVRITINRWVNGILQDVSYIEAYYKYTY